MAGTQEISQVGKRQDIADLIAIADAKETNFTSAIRKGKKPGNTLVEWQADKFDTPRTTGTVDGKDVQTTEDASKNRQKLYGRLQIFRRAPQVTNLAEKVSIVAGISNPAQNNPTGNTEFARAKAVKMVEVKRDKEQTFLSDNDSQADNGDLPYLTRGLGSWISSSAQTDLPVPVDYRTPTASIFSAAIAGFDENAFRALLQSRWDQTGVTNELNGYVGSAIKNAITDFSRYEANKSNYTPVRFYNDKDKGAKISTKVDVYEGDYGTVLLFLNSFMPNQYRGYFVDMNFLEERPVDAGSFEQLENQGGGPRGIIEQISCLVNLNPLGHAAAKATA